ncbi:MAG: hypothetical protein IPO21_18570 [Bacteroidales bacterium]|nr:hypothetical protein [Bacteroidales bacterium]
MKKNIDMELHELFKKWNLNHNFFSNSIGMHKGTFNNKLNSKHPSKFSAEENNQLIKLFRLLEKDLRNFNAIYPMQEEILNPEPDDVAPNYGN